MTGDLLERYRQHLVSDVMGWWLHKAPDDQAGGVFTCWTNDGSRLLSQDKYTWSQGRWAWLMARLSMAARRGLVDLDAEQCLARALRTAVFLRDHAMLGQGATAYVTSADGEPKDGVAGLGFHTSIFADFFAALGFAGVARATGSRAWGELADELLAAGAARIAGGPVPTEPYPIRTGYAAFSLPMILVGTGTEVHRATGSHSSAEITMDAARAIQDVFLRDSEIAEMVPQDPGEADTLLARHRTPGHVLEACWFLADAAELFPHLGLTILDPATLAGIARRAFALGWDEADGGILRYVDRAGGMPQGRRSDDRYEALVLSTWDTKLWWPNVEAIYSLLRLGRGAGDAGLLDLHAQVDAYVFRTFPAGAGKEWIQIRDRAGQPLDRTVALPVKDPFHIARALLLAVELLEE